MWSRTILFSGIYWWNIQNGSSQNEMSQSSMKYFENYVQICVQRRFRRQIDACTDSLIGNEGESGKLF